LKDYELDEARIWLSIFVEARALAAEDRLGFGWLPADDAPEDYPALRAAFYRSRLTGAPLPVATVNVTPSVFVSAQSNWAMRFWHDVTHVELDAGFGFRDEQRVAAHHLAALEAAGRPPGSLEWVLLRADTVGQNLVYAMTGGGFVADQWEFTLDVLRSGLPLAVLKAVQHLENTEVCPETVVRLRRLLEAS